GLLRLLGIADPSYAPNFYTLAHVVRSGVADGALIAECGVYRGSTLLGMAHALKNSGVRDWQLVGFDSFEGFPEPTPHDARGDGSLHPAASKGNFADSSFERLRRGIRALGFENRVTLVKGFFEDTLPAWSDRRFSLVHLDCDLYQSYKTCLEFFYPRTNAGGAIVFDEYDHCKNVYPGAQRAIDEFFSDKPERIQALPGSPVPRYFVIKR
ncbi:MAG: class I SAM-dependent methyltransferase, partial [Candidatus Eremiobacteraeota bacterium]|nr:class I SAM-dependent methyltransferase [Candidatus Eremiobacteraeota bacterium]